MTYSRHHGPASLKAQERGDCATSNMNAKLGPGFFATVSAARSRSLILIKPGVLEKEENEPFLFFRRSRSCVQRWS